MCGVMLYVSAYLPSLIRMCLFDWKAVRSRYILGQGVRIIGVECVIVRPFVCVLGVRVSCHIKVESVDFTNMPKDKTDVIWNITVYCIHLSKDRKHLSLQLSDLLPSGWWRAVRRLSVGSYGICFILPPRQLGSHFGHQPPGPEWPNSPPAPRGEVPATLWGLWVSSSLL